MAKGNRNSRSRTKARSRMFLERSRRLTEFGFGGYDEYLQSQAWRDRREAFYSSNGRQCHVCSGSDRLQLHHLTYKRVCSEDDRDLVALCRECHETIHSCPDGFGRNAVKHLREAYARTGRRDTYLIERRLQRANGGARCAVSWIQT